jgi:predicted transcriptional regulator
MHITFDELRKLKHDLPTGSVSRIAEELGIEEQTVRNYFGAMKYEDGKIVGKHIQQGPNGGIVDLEDDTIYNLAKKIISEARMESNVQE